jgi:hypothetical protein
MADVLAELQALDDHLRLSGGSVAALLAHHAVQAHGLPQWTAVAPVARREPVNTPMPAHTWAYQPDAPHQPGTISHETPVTHSPPAHDPKADTKDAKDHKADNKK